MSGSLHRRCRGKPQRPGVSYPEPNRLSRGRYA